MRGFLFHPLVFYPLAALLAVGVILFSIQPLAWPRAAQAGPGRIEDGAIVLDGASFSAPEGEAAQVIKVVRGPFGDAQALRIAVLPNQAAPGPSDKGVQVLLEQAAAQLLAGRPATLEITVRPLPVTTAAELAASVQGAGPATWASQPLSTQEQVLSYSLPAMAGANAIGLRAIPRGADYNYGIEIAKIRIVPSGAAVQQNN